jgi:signal transduction histidine kinase
VGRAAVDLPWLCPNTDSLVGLAEDPASLSAYAADPGLFCFLSRFALGEAGSPFTTPNDRLVSGLLPDTAAAYLTASPDGWVDASLPLAKTVIGVSERAARFAKALADETRRSHTEAAATAARLAPLGWFAVLAVDPAAATACLDDPHSLTDPAACQEKHWELDHDAIARRLAGRWRFPSWLASLVGSLNLPFEAAAYLGADADLFALVSLAVKLAEENGANLGLTHHSETDRLLAHLGLTRDSLDEIEIDEPPALATSSLDQNPHRVPLVANLLRASALARRRSGAALVMQLEERIDELHRSAGTLAELAGIRLREAKLAALAEFAAGAGHEINNPLAVISGNAQRLLRTEQDDDRADSLRAVVRQSQRISGILRDLMQFARPPKPQAEPLLVLTLANGVYLEMLPLAEERGVRFELANAAADARLHADGKQLRAALVAVVRNGIEAAGEAGWVRLECSRQGDRIRFLIEDSGDGLNRDAAEHAFDPFFSGRTAGRGRGLGLSTAWRLTTQNGGDIRLDDADGVARFVLTFPESAPAAERRSA